MNITHVPAPQSEAVESLIRRIVSEITCEPEKTKIVSERFGFGSVAIEIDAWPGDYGKVLGKNRAILSALKMICKLISDRTGIDYQLTLKRVPEGQPNAPMPEFKPTDDWPEDRIRELTNDIFSMILASQFRVVVSNGSHGATEIAVLLGSDLHQNTVVWIRETLRSLYQSIGLKNRRIITFKLIEKAI